MVVTSPGGVPGTGAAVRGGLGSLLYADSWQGKLKP
jgi:hypothetical protein